MARSKLTEELCDKICKDIQQGGTLKYAAMHNGITEQTFYNWMKRGEESKTQTGKFFEFFESVKRAQEDGKTRLISKIEMHGERNWQALAWLLERMYPDEFGRTQRVDMRADVKSENKTTVKEEATDFDVKSLSPELRAELTKLISKIREERRKAQPRGSGDDGK